MTCLEVFATLRIFSSSLHPDEISHIIGVNATQSRPIEPNSKYRPRREHHYWGWESRSEIQTRDGLDHVRAVIGLLQGREHLLKELREGGCDIDVCCYWVSSGQGGPLLDVPTLGALARLGLEIWWDVYFGEEEEYVEATAGNIAGGA